MKVTKKYVNDAKEDAARGCANAKLQERCAGLGYALLPLTPALSLGEREKPRCGGALPGAAVVPGPGLSRFAPLGLGS